MKRLIGPHYHEIFFPIRRCGLAFDFIFPLLENRNLTHPIFNSIRKKKLGRLVLFLVFCLLPITIIFCDLVVNSFGKVYSRTRVGSGPGSLQRPVS
jgi:hypothetical protein